jgi:hypothetical protein
MDLAGLFWKLALLSLRPRAAPASIAEGVSPMAMDHSPITPV